MSSRDPREPEMIAAFIRQFLYHPYRLDRDEPLPPYAAAAREAFVRTDDGLTIHGLYWPPPEGRPVVLYFHGNAQSVFEWAMAWQEFRPARVGLLLMDYRGYGKSEGEPDEEGLYRDGDAAWRWLTHDAGIAARRVVALGKSLGGGVVGELASKRELGGVILESTFTSIPSVAKYLFPFLPVDAAVKSERYATLEKMPAIRAPVFVIHGDRDELIPLAEGRRLYEAANEPKEMWVVPHAGHNDVSYTAGAEYGRRIQDFIDRRVVGVGE